MSIDVSRLNDRIVLPPQINLVKKFMSLGCINPYKQNKFTKIFHIVGILCSGSLLLLSILEIVLNWKGIESLTKAVYLPGIFIVSIVL